ncbi:MAG: hypothetical protein M3R27_03520, partial [Bacteroidota bacterium]|nr:hypothetical protein [Bacteroidota bacterium]
FIVVLHATRIPPHIGIIAGNSYHSLSIKGQERNIPLSLVLKNIRVRRIPSLFIRIIDHQRLTGDEISEQFLSDLSSFEKVSAQGATCLSPIKPFFERVYNVPATDIRYIFDLLPKLEQAELIMEISSLFIEEPVFTLPVYDMDEINHEILKAESEAIKIKKQ